MLLGSMARALKPGGKFFIEVRSVHDPLYGKGEALERNAFFYDNHYRRFLVLDELTEALRQAGFRIELRQGTDRLRPLRQRRSPRHPRCGGEELRRRFL